MKLLIYQLSVLLLVLIGIISYAQEDQIYFYRRYNTDGIMGFGCTIKHSNKYINTGYRNFSNGFHRYYLYFTDIEGNYLNHKVILQNNDTIKYYFYGNSTIESYNDKIYVIATKEVLNTPISKQNLDLNKNKVLFLKCDLNGEIISNTEIEFSGAYASIHNSLYFNGLNNQIYLLGRKYIQIEDSTLNNIQQKVVLACLDTSGNMLWEREYGEYGYNPYVASLRRNLNGGFFITGSTQRYSQLNSVLPEYNIINTDSIGGLIWQKRWSYEANKREGISDIFPLNNGNFIVTGAIANQQYNNSSGILGYLNNQGVMTYYKRILHNNGFITATTIFKHKDRLLCLVNYRENGQNGRSICLYEFNENLDSLGCTFFDFNGRQHLYGMEQLPDGGFLFAGFMDDENNMNQQAWLMRIDNNLCANPLCLPVGIEETTQTAFLENEMVVYPNPSSGEFTISFGEEKVKDIEIYNSMGKLLAQYPSNGDNQLAISLSQNANGIYFIKIKKEDGTEVNQKIIKQ